MSTKTKLLVLSIAAVLVIAFVIILAFVMGSKQGVGDISYDDYNKLIKKENTVIYYGKDSKKNDVEGFSKKYDIDIAVLSPNDLSKSEIKSINLKDEHLYVFNKGKKVYDGDFASSKAKVAKGLMEKKFIDKSYIEVTLDEYKDLVKSDGYNIMFIGRETCSWCSQFKESIKKALKDNDFTIYYIDTDTLKGQSDYDELYATDSYLKEEEWGTPLTLIYKDGKRIDVINGYVDDSALVETLKKNKVL